MFWKKRQINSEEYDKVLKKIAEFSTILSDLSAKVAAVQSDAANLRGQFNRKVSGLKKEEAAEEVDEDVKSEIEKLKQFFNLR